jgi:FtsP/CotA-like multicopper oxidase with cupredoxin domain
MLFLSLGVAPAVAAPPPGAAAQPTLDPLTIPKYQDPLIVPPAMPKAAQSQVYDFKTGQWVDNYEIEVTQFEQYILPQSMGKKTTVWSYSAVGHPETKNYPAFTIEAIEGRPTRVKWINNLVDASGTPLPHLLGNVVDQTLHWANPPATGCADGTNRTDCRGTDPTPYTGPVPIVTHVHGAHVGPESDGYPEAWWLPKGAPAEYTSGGTLFDDYVGTPPGEGYAVYQYPNTMRPTTLWYHDHALGMTRLNVYAGPAGFFLVRGPEETALGFPGIAPQENESPFGQYFELPVVIQDRSFNDDGSLFYPDNRAFFEGLTTVGPGQDLDIPFIGDPTGTGLPSDISAIWNPEAFFNTMVVNGRTWPYVDVDRSTYRLRLLDGCNSRFLIVKLVYLDPAGDGDPNNSANWVDLTNEFRQIGADGGFLPRVVAKDRLLMAPAERADVLVNFQAINRQLADAGIPVADRAVYLVNVGPDEPFGGGEPDADFDAADPATTGQIMKFVIKPGHTYDNLTTATLNGRLLGTDPLVVRSGGQYVDPVSGAPVKVRTLSLNEEVSGLICAAFGPDSIKDVTALSGAVPGANFEADCTAYEVAYNASLGITDPDDPNWVTVEPMGPKAAVLGTLDPVTKLSTPLLWMDAITENPQIGDTEVWEVYNLTMDAHPIHLHLVQYQLLDRQQLDPLTLQPLPGTRTRALPEERGLKDTSIMYPGEVTRLAAHFDMAGLYVWHCHIVEHEDNEMMRPYIVRYVDDLNGDGRVNFLDLVIILAKLRSETLKPSVGNLAYDLNGDGVFNLLDARFLTQRILGII